MVEEWGPMHKQLTKGWKRYIQVIVFENESSNNSTIETKIEKYVNCGGYRKMQFWKFWYRVLSIYHTDDTYNKRTITDHLENHWDVR